MINDPMNDDYRKKFLLKLEELKAIADISTFLYKGKYGEYIKDFALSYVEVLFEMFKYELFLIRKASSSSKGPSYEKHLNDSEKKKKDELRIVIRNLDHAYEVLVDKNVDKEIRKQLKYLKFGNYKISTFPFKFPSPIRYYICRPTNDSDVKH